MASLSQDSKPKDFSVAYASGVLDELFELRPDDLSAALAAPRPTNRAALCAALEAQARRLGAPGAVLANIRKLAHPESRAVVTGQQTGLLLGPTYSLAKAATAIRLAQRLDRPDRPVVPVFWLASQDHDAAEIDHTYLLDGSETLRRLSVSLPDGVAAGRMPYQPAMLGDVLKALSSLVPRSKFEPEVAALLDGAAARSATYVDWFATILYDLLGQAGLVLVDPLDPEVARLSLPLLEREIAEPRRTPEAVNAAARRIEELGFQAQLGRGEGATNLFVELAEAGALPRRALLRFEGGKFLAEGQSFSAADLLARLAQDPARITPAAGLRPVTQDALLPTAVFVLGPGELRYVAQLREVYRFHEVAMPLAWLRARATVLEPAAVRMLARFGVSAAAFRTDPEGHLQRALLERHAHAGAFDQAGRVLEESFGKLLKHVAGVDPTLEGTVERGRRHLDITLAKLRGKTAAALSRSDATTRRQYERLRAHLLPLGEPSERVLSPFSHMLKFGPRPLIDRLLAIEPQGEQELRL